MCNPPKECVKELWMIEYDIVLHFGFWHWVNVSLEIGRVGEAARPELPECLWKGGAKDALG